MIGKIALEEHFAIPEYNGPQAPPFIDEEVWQDIRRRIVDFEEHRLPEMDRNNIEYSIISLTSPGVQAETSAPTAVQMARKSNDTLAAAIAKHPTRLGGFAAIPLQDTDAAVTELERAVQELGFHGALVNSYTTVDADGGAAYVDEPRFEPFWAKLEELGVPLYLHPRQLLDGQRAAIAGRPELTGPVWEFGVDASASALRLVTSGLLDRHPDVSVILGHLGESLPYNLQRIETRLSKAADRPRLRLPFPKYFQERFYVTTSGHFTTSSLTAAVAAMGRDRVMFSVDYPYDDMTEAADWFDNAAIPEATKKLVGRENAARLFGLR